MDHATSRQGIAMSPDTAEAVEFLIRYRATGPIVLTAITPDESTRHSRTFSPAQEQERLRHWIDARQGSRNLYFGVNPAAYPIWGQRVPRDWHIRAVSTLQVDIDPVPGEDLRTERERILHGLRAFSPPPSIIIDSGGGYQGFWLLDRMHPIRDEDTAVHLEGYNRSIALQLGGDSCCYNIGTLMRLPGTINLPTQNKIGCGRAPALARLLEFHEHRRYRLNRFKRKPRKRPPEWPPEWMINPPGEQPEENIEVDLTSDLPF